MSRSVNSLGSITQSDDYYPFGLTFNSLRPSSPNNYLFNGVEQDQATGNYEMMFRGYDPALGRFMQIDPLADFMPGINPYQFAFNNPISFNDPSGLAPKWFIRLRAHVNRFKNFLEGSNKAGEASGYTGRGKNRDYYTYRTDGGKRRGKDIPLYFPDPPRSQEKTSEIESITKFEELEEQLIIPEELSAINDNKSRTFNFQEGGKLVTDRNDNIFPSNIRGAEDIYPSAMSKYIVPIANTLIKYPFLKLTIVPQFINLSHVRPNANDAPGLQTRAQAIMEALLGLGVDKSQLGIYYGEYLPKGKGVVNQPVKFIFKK